MGSPVTQETVRGRLRNARQCLRLALEEGKAGQDAGTLIEAAVAADRLIADAVATLDSIMGEVQLAQRWWLVERLEREV